MKRLLLRVLATVAIGLACLYPLYLLAGNAYLRSGGLERLINRRPERLRMQWRSAWTLWPGAVSVRGFQMRSQTSVFQWWLAVDRATFDIDLVSLRGRELLIGSLHGRGASFRLRRRLDAPPRRVPAQPAFYPPIPGFADPPHPAPEALYPPLPGPPRPPWHMRFAGVKLDDVREIWIEEYRFTGKARMAGAFETRVRESLEVMPARVDFLSGGFFLGGGSSQPILTAAHGRVDGRIERYPPLRFRGWDVFRFASGQVAIGGRVQSLGFLSLLFRQTRWVDLRVGPGGLDADIRLKRGEILAGSRLRAHPDGVSVGLFDYRAVGFGGVTWTVEPAADRPGGRQGRLALVFDTFRLQRQGYPGPHVRGEGLRIEALSEAPRFGGLFLPRSVAVDMPRAEVPDLTFYNAYLPRRTPLALTGGSGRMSGSFQAEAPEWKGAGDFRLAARGVSARFEEKSLRGDVDLHTRLRSIDLDDRRFDVSGTDFELKNVALLDGASDGAWWARVHLDSAVLEPGAPVFLRARLESTLSDPRPLFALFAPAERGRVLRWVDRLLDIHGVGATADLLVGQDYLDVSHLAVAGGKAQLLGRLRFADSTRRGVLYASYGAFDVGLELAGQKRGWKLLRPRRWFDRYPPFD